MNALIEEEKYDDAAKLCVKLFGKNKEMWENEAYKFASIRQLKVMLYKTFVMFTLWFTSCKYHINVRTEDLDIPIFR